MKLWNDFGVRALLGVIIVAPAIGALVYMVVTTNSKDAMVALVAISSAVAGYYFGQRSNT